MALPGSGIISVGMINYEKANKVGTGTTLNSTNVATTANADFKTLANDYWANADVEGSTSRADLFAGPYGMDEWYGYTYSTCVLVGTEILMADGSIKLVEDLLIDDEVCSTIIPNMTENNYRDFSVDNLNGFKKETGLLKRLTFDFIKRFVQINKKYNVTEKHPSFVWKNDIKRFEWWQAQDIKVGDKMVTSNFELEEVTTVEKMNGDFEIVTLGLRNIHTYFANGYLCHQ